MAKAYQSGDVIIRTVELRNDNLSARVSLLPQLQGFDVWEDMAKPTIYATLYLNDAIGLLHSFPIIGGEDVTIEFETPGMAAAARYKFKVMEVTNIVESDNRKSVSYTVRLISEEHFENATHEVRQSFSGLLSDLVVMTTTQYLNSTKKITIEPTKGIYSVVSPKLAPLELIDYCRVNAVSVSHPTSSYVFFENQSGFYFKTVEQLVEEGRRSSVKRVFTILQNPTAVPHHISYRSILDHENMTRSDTLELINGGSLHAEVEQFDVFTKTSSHTRFHFNDHFGKMSGPDARMKAPQTPTFINKYGGGDPERFYFSSDSSRPEQHVQNMLAPRNAYVQLLNSNITRVHVHGDSALRAGDVVELNLPATQGTTGPRPSDPLMSGNYILLRLRHVVSGGPKARHTCAFDAAKIGFRG